jgi:hypothetical protein
VASLQPNQNEQQLYPTLALLQLTSFFPNFSYNAKKRPNPANGIDSRSLAKSMVLKSFSLQYQTDAHPLFLPLNNPIQKKLFCMHFINYR